MPAERNPQLRLSYVVFANATAVLSQNEVLANFHQCTALAAGSAILRRFPCKCREGRLDARVVSVERRLRETGLVSVQAVAGGISASSAL